MQCPDSKDNLPQMCGSVELSLSTCYTFSLANCTLAQVPVYTFSICSKFAWQVSSKSKVSVVSLQQELCKSTAWQFSHSAPLWWDDYCTTLLNQNLQQTCRMFAKKVDLESCNVDMLQSCNKLVKHSKFSNSLASYRHTLLYGHSLYVHSRVRTYPRMYVKCLTSTNIPAPMRLL